MEKTDWSHLDEIQKDELLELFLQLASLSIEEKGELGLIKKRPAHIQVSDPNPCRTPVYKYPEKAKETISNILKDLEE